MGADPDLLTTAPARDAGTPARIVGASAIGASHRRGGKPCQDAYAVASSAQGFAIALCDGMGTALHAATGARTAADAAVEELDDAGSMARRARGALELLAGQLDCDLEDLGCTLLALCVRGDRITLAHIGDGAIVGLDSESSLHVLSGQDRAEYVNETTPLTSSEWETALRTSEPQAGTIAFGLFTDGCAHAALTAAAEAHPGFWHPVFSFVRDAADLEVATSAFEALLAGDKLGEHSDDDKTLVVAWL